MSVLVILDLLWIKVKVFDKLAWNKALFHHEKLKTYAVSQGSGNFEIWIGPADDDDVINEPISPKKICIYHLSRKLMTIGSPITPFK